jgi:hypothetical protein
MPLKLLKEMERKSPNLEKEKGLVSRPSLVVSAEAALPIF